MSEDAARDAILLAKRLEQILADDAFKMAIASLRQSYVSEWERGQTVEAREAAWQKREMLHDITREFNRLIGDGQMWAMRLK